MIFPRFDTLLFVCSRRAREREWPRLINKSAWMRNKKTEEFFWIYMYILNFLCFVVTDMRVVCVCVCVCVNDRISVLPLPVFLNWKMFCLSRGVCCTCSGHDARMLFLFLLLFTDVRDNPYLSIADQNSISIVEFLWKSPFRIPTINHLRNPFPIGCVVAQSVPCDVWGAQHVPLNSTLVVILNEFLSLFVHLWNSGSQGQRKG